MKRRSFLQSAVVGGVGANMLNTATLAAGTVAKMKITRVRAYMPPVFNPLGGQSNMVVTVETDAGITGIGEGGWKELIENCAAFLIGQDANDTDHLWQMMYRGDFYPAGREKLDALGALDMALWDLKAKAFDVPLYQLLGGVSRNYIECYSGGDYDGNGRTFSSGMSLKERARATIETGFRCFRTGPADLETSDTYNTHERIPVAYQQCQEIREAVGASGDWAIDFHTRFDLADAMRLTELLEPLAPYFVEDPLRADAVEVYPQLRAHTKVPIAAGEQWGCRWDFAKLVESQLIDYVRATLPNVGGITEYLKIAVLCETHFVGLIPHFTGPISTAALIHCAAPFSGPVLFEYGGGNYEAPHLPKWADFKNGKWWFNERPGLGVEFDASKCRQVAEVTEPIGNRRPEYYRPDGSFTQW
jgi:L-alanine-DL-glutamate epimerase-like enolase superfamily enzyme